VNGYLHTPAALYLEKSPWYPLDRKLGEPKNHPGQDGKKTIPTLDHVTLLTGSIANLSTNPNVNYYPYFTFKQWMYKQKIKTVFNVNLSLNLSNCLK
jgi:hypothetical protein